MSRHGFPKGKTLGAGVIDGRNIWRSDLNAVAALLGQLAEQINAEQLIVQPSCSLLHVPVSLEAEHKLDRELVHALAFADEKLDEIAVLTAALGKHDPSALAKLEQSAEAVARFKQLSGKGTDSCRFGRPVGKGATITQRSFRRAPYNSAK
ncbi:hypothetical protein ABFY57_00265 [Paenibacillus polymyxa]|uniref:hypothetical protein n=1 Tax=Paenibacillus polymyxa TaxID=1406 RepID=UPI003D293480